jgi:hypothetical protein
LPLTEQYTDNLLSSLLREKFLSALLFFCLPLSLFAQPITENKLLAEEISPSIETKAATAEIVYDRIPKSAIKKISFENLDVKKSDFNNKTVFSPSQIDRSFSVNNPFDVEDLSNPFNLPRPGSKNRILAKEKESQTFQKFFHTLFEYKEAAKKTVVNKKPELVAPYWILFSLLLMLVTFAYQTVVFKSENRKVFQAYTSSTSALQQYRDKKSSLGLYDILSNALFVLSAGHFIFVASNIWLHSKEIEPNWNFSALAVSFLGVSAVYFSKYLKLLGLGMFFPFKSQLNYYNYIISNGNRVLALLLTPLLFFMVYSPESIKFLALYAGLGILAVNFGYRYFRTAVASSDIIMEHKIHFFIYLCAVELAPVLILLKLLSVI